MNRIRRIALTFLFLPLLAIITDHAAAQVRTVELNEMVESSGMIFSGIVTEKRSEFEDGNVVTYTTFRVETPIRGVMPGQVTIKQFGGVVESGPSLAIAHMRYFTEGERVLVMLYGSSELGFTSPIGMNQGAWSVSDAGTVTGLNREIFKELGDLPSRYRALPDADGGAPLSGMISLIQQVAVGGTK